MPSITLDHVTKRFPDGTVAVRDADFTIEDGELFILVGPSGCGKSTLLGMIAGLETVTEGEIRVDGRRVNELDPRHRNMAMVFQSYAIYPHMSVRQNLAFPLTLARMGKAEIAGRVERAAQILGLQDLLDRRPAALSGGQRQRVAMGRAIVREPAAFLLDEPLSNLDARLRVQMRTEIARLQKRLGTTTVYVTHDQTEAMTLGDRVAVLRDGELQQIGSPRELYRRPRNLFVAGFIGSPGMNLLPAEVDGDRLRLPMAELAVPGPLRAAVRGHGGPLIAGIRPEDLRDAALAGTDAPGPRFTARVDVLEWMGAELYLYLPLEGDAARRLAGLTGRPAGGADGLSLVARVDAASEAAEDAAIELVLDPARLQLFDPATGERLRGDRGDR